MRGGRGRVTARGGFRVQAVAIRLGHHISARALSKAVVAVLGKNVPVLFKEILCFIKEVLDLLQQLERSLMESSDTGLVLLLIVLGEAAVQVIGEFLEPLGGVSIGGVVFKAHGLIYYVLYQKKGLL